MCGIKQPRPEFTFEIFIRQNPVAVDLVLQRRFLEGLRRRVVAKHFQEIVGAEIPHRRFRRMRDLKVGFDAVDIFRPDQIQRAVAGQQPGCEVRARDRQPGGIEPAPRDLRAGDGDAAALDRGVTPRLQHDIQRHRQPWRGGALAGWRSRGAGQPVDQPDFAAALWRHERPVHAVDDAGQHEARPFRIEQRAIEQLEIERHPDADGFVRKLDLVRGDVTIELAIERPADRSHRRQCEQLSAGQGKVGRSGRPHHPPQRQSAAIEFAQGCWIGDRGAALQRRAFHGVGRQRAAEQNENANEKSQCAAFPSESRASCGQHRLIRKIAEKQPGCLAAIRRTA